MALSLRAIHALRYSPALRHCALLSVRTSPEKACQLSGVLSFPAANGLPTIAIRNMSGKRLLIIHPTRFAWRRFKRDVHLFAMIGIIPLTLITLYANLFIGPAELQEIPEGYCPKEYEYYKHPLSRFFIKNVQEVQQRGYEIRLHLITQEEEKTRLIRLHDKARALQAERQDYQGFLWNETKDTKYAEFVREKTDTLYEEKADALRPILGP